MRFKNLKVIQVNFESQIIKVFCNCRVNIVELVNYIESFEPKDTGIEEKSKKTEPKGYHDVDKFYRDQSKEVMDEIRLVMMTDEITDPEKCICEIRKILNNQ